MNEGQSQSSPRGQGTPEHTDKYSWCPRFPHLAAAHQASCTQGKKGTQSQSYGEHLVYHPLPLNKTGSREERMLSGDGQHRLGIFISCPCTAIQATHAGASSSSVQSK